MKTVRAYAVFSSWSAEPIITSKLSTYPVGSYGVRIRVRSSTASFADLIKALPRIADQSCPSRSKWFFPSPDDIRVNIEPIDLHTGLPK